MDIHSGTGKSPITLLNIEKDSLQPLPTKAIRSPYQRYRQLHKVNQSSMITYQSNQYSVPAEYIGKSLLLESDNELLSIYDSIKLVVIHPISSDKKLNDHSHHYTELLRKQQPFRSNEELEQQTHLATAIGIEAAKARYSTYFIKCHELLTNLRQAQHENRLESRLKFYTHCKFLIIDELGYLPLHKGDYSNSSIGVMRIKVRLSQRIFLLINGMKILMTRLLRMRYSIDYYIILMSFKLWVNPTA